MFLCVLGVGDASTISPIGSPKLGTRTMDDCMHSVHDGWGLVGIGSYLHNESGWTGQAPFVVHAVNAIRRWRP